MRLFGLIRVVVAAAGLLFVVESLQGQSVDAVKSVPIAGVVVDADNLPISNAVVRMERTKFEAETETGADGTFALEVPNNQLSGLRFVVATDDGQRLGYATLPWSQQPQPPGEPLRVVVEPARRVELTAVDAEGQPVADAFASVSVGYLSAAHGRTDTQGKATLRVPRSAPLQHVYVMKPDVGFDYFLYRHPEAPASDPYQLAPDHAEPLRFVLNGTFAVEVRVEDDNRRPLAGATVYPWLFRKPKKGDDINLSGDDVFKSQTNSEGMVSFRFFPSDCERTVTIWTQIDGYIATERINFDPQQPDESLVSTLLQLVPIRGQVVHADGVPAADIEVLVVGDGHGLDDFRQSTRTDSEGKFNINGNPNMYYQFVAGNDESVSPAVNCVVLDESPAPVELTLQPAVRVFGTVTMGANETPQPDQSVSLYQEQAVSYYDLPEDERVPNPTDSSYAISPHTVRWLQTDADGQYEFFVGPGKFYMFGPQNREAIHFEITDQRAHELNLQLPGPATVMASGRVVLADDENVTVPEAVVEGVAVESFSMRNLRATTRADGEFEAERPMSEMVVLATKRAENLAGMLRSPAGETEITIAIGPTATARCWLYDAVSGLPLAERQIRYGINIEFSDGTTSTRFGGTSHTDAQGRFEIARLIPGWDYELSVVTEFDKDGRGRSWMPVGTVSAAQPGEFDAGQFELKPSRDVDDMKVTIAKVFASDVPLEDRLAANLRDARLGHQRVLMVVGVPESDLCQRFFNQYFSFRGELLQGSLANFKLLAVDATKEQANDLDPASPTFGLPWPTEGGLVLVIFDETGRLIDDTSATQFAWPDGRMNVDALAVYLDEHAPDLPDAQQLLGDAVKSAERDSRRVLVQFSGPRCYPCLLLSRFLAEHAELIERDYVVVKIDSRFANAGPLLEKMKPAESGVPWWAIYDAELTRLATSDGPDGNIGFPSSDVGIAHFEQMFRSTAKSLGDGDIRKLVADLQGESQ